MDKQKYKRIASFLTGIIYLFLLLFVLDYASITRYAVKTKAAQEEVVVDITALDVKEIMTTKTPQIVEQKVQKAPAAVKSVKNLFSDSNDSFDSKEFFKDKVVVKTRTKKKKISVDELFDTKVARKPGTKKIIEQMETSADAGGASLATEGISDAYIDKVHAIISAGWQPLPSQKGMVATMILRIASDGNFRFYIKGTNGDAEFLEMLKKHMQKLQAVGLPKPDKERSVTINFIAKE